MKFWLEVDGKNVVVVFDDGNGHVERQNFSDEQFMTALESIQDKKKEEIFKKIIELLSFFPEQPLFTASQPFFVKFYPGFFCLSVGRKQAEEEWIPELTISSAEIETMSMHDLIAEVFEHFLFDEGGDVIDID